MDRSKFRGPSPDDYILNSQKVKYDDKELKKIKVAIKVKVPSAKNDNNETQELDHSLDKPEELKIHRKHGEGSHPIFEREGIVVNKESAEHRTVSARSPQRYHRRSASVPRREEHGHRSRNSRTSPRYSRDSPRRRNRSRSRDSPGRSRRQSRSRSRSSRRELDRRHSSRSHDRNRRSTERSDYRRRSLDRRDHYRSSRNDYGHSARDRRYRSRSPRYGRSPPRRRSRTPLRNVAPINPNALGAIPFIYPPDVNFYGPENGLWYHTPLRPPPVMIPPGMIPPGARYSRFPLGFRGAPPPMRPRFPPYLPGARAPPQIRAPLNRPPRPS